MYANANMHQYRIPVCSNFHLLRFTPVITADASRKVPEANQKIGCNPAAFESCTMSFMPFVMCATPAAADSATTKWIRPIVCHSIG